MTQLGHSRPDRACSKSGLVRCPAETGSIYLISSHKNRFGRWPTVDMTDISQGRGPAAHTTSDTGCISIANVSRNFDVMM
jgi:hypothetical protein